MDPHFLNGTQTGRGLEKLELVDCLSLAAANIRTLSPLDCRMRDTRSLVEAVRTGRGPRGLVTTGFLRWPSPFGTAGGWVSFFQALGSEGCRLEHLSFEYLPRGNSVLQALVNALLENTSLVHFGLTNLLLRNRFWNELLEAISRHPSIQSLQLPKFQDPEIRGLDDSGERTKEERTKNIIELI